MQHSSDLGETININNHNIWHKTVKDWTKENKNENRDAGLTIVNKYNYSKFKKNLMIQDAELPENILFASPMLKWHLCSWWCW